MDTSRSQLFGVLVSCLNSLIGLVVSFLNISGIFLVFPVLVITFPEQKKNMYK